MRDQLLRQALESRKTVSKKAQSKQSSRASSVANSRTVSASVSTNVSEDGSDDDVDDNLSDSTNWSTNGLEDLVAYEPRNDEDLSSWREEIRSLVESITDRKASGVAEREKSLARFNHIVTHRYVSAAIETLLPDLVGAFSKIIKNENSEKEASLAIKALSLTIITCPENPNHENAAGSFKKAYETSQSFAVKAAAIHGRSIAAAYGGADADDESDIDTVMNEYLEIIETDGNSIEAGDSHEVVLAALESWGFLATLIEDFEDSSQEAVEAFVEQLESSYPQIQIAAGENIALLFEKSYTETEEGEEDDSGQRIKAPYVKRYDAYRQINQLKHTLSQLATDRHRFLPKKEQRMVHENFNDILRTVEDPTLGPKYKTTRDGSVKYMRIIVGKSAGGEKWVRSVVLDAWWKLHRLNGLRRLLGSGFLVHYQENEVLEETLPSKQLAVVHTEKGGFTRTVKGQNDAGYYSD